MRRNPKCPQPDAPAPPQEQGQRLATFPRGESAEFRLTLASYQGRPYVALRVWERDRDGAWWPVKSKGTSIRITEIPGVVEALRQAEALTAAPADREAAPLAGRLHRPARGTGPKGSRRAAVGRPDWREAGLPAAGAPGGAFDEFGGAG